MTPYLFFNYLNSQHPNIKFTFEKQINGKLPFLDILVDNSSDTCITSVFHKKTYTGLLTNLFSFAPFNYKTGLIRTLIDRTFKINNTETGFKKDNGKLSETLKRNCYPISSYLILFIDKIVKQYSADKTKQSSAKHDCPSNTGNTNLRYVKLPFIGQYSRLTQIKIKKKSIV